MKIALIGPYPPPYGGVSTTVKQLAEHLVKDGHDVAVIATSPPSHDLYQIDVSVRHFPSEVGWFRFLQKWQPDIIHSHSSRWSSPKAISIALVLRIPIVHTIHGEQTPNVFAELSPWRRMLARLCIFLTDMTLTVSKPLSEFLSSIGLSEHKIQIIPSLLPLENVTYVSGREVIAEAAQILITTTGFYDAEYGFWLIPEVAARLEKRSIDFKWCVVGHGTAAEMRHLGDKATRMGVEQRLTLIGEMDRFQMLDLLSRTHVYVRTKYSDSFGIVIAEAHQLGCECLFGDNNPYFQDGARLTKYRTGDVDSLTENLLAIISRLSLNKPQDAESKFALEAQANLEAIERIYKNVAAGE